MPELPEVETIRRGLDPLIGGLRVLGVRVRERRLRAPVSPRRLRRLQGQTIRAVRRRSKYLLVDTSGGLTLLIHLGMSGRLWVSRRGRARRPHEHVVFTLEGGRELRYADARRFGMVDVIDSARVADDPRIRVLGPEPVDGTLTGEALYRVTRGRRVPVKNFLLNTRAIAGIGNIYACETLHRSGVHPARAVGRIGHDRWVRLTTVLKAVLNEAIRAGGTTLRDFINAEENAGYFALALRVYDREGKPCRRCGVKIRRIVQAGRSTFYCPRCQR